MATHALRLIEDRLGENESTAELPGTYRTVYVVEGRATVKAHGSLRWQQPNSAWFGMGACSFSAGAEGARLWRWELLKLPLQDDGLIADVSSLKDCQEIDLDPSGEYLMRCDRVDFPLGGIAYTHIHPGPGIRCLLDGELVIEVEGKSFTVGPGGSWFERGPDPIMATASTTQLTGFARGMILPRSLMGVSSIQYVKEEDKEKPKPQKYTRFVDEFIEIN
tara:strand:+ start:219 stop:878 length:660 start_codon:yes stop_codon:yes gene_type:complete